MRCLGTADHQAFSDWTNRDPAGGVLPAKRLADPPSCPGALVPDDVRSDGNQVENSITRYALGDRTPGLVPDPDAGLKRLCPEQRAGWPKQRQLVPSPEDDAFYLIMRLLRLYLPDQAETDGHWSPPAVQRVQ